MDGIKAKVAAGNHGQIKADAILGKRYFDIDLLVWGSAYRNSGDRPIGNHPSYDLGLQLGYKGLQLMYDTHFSQVAAPFTMGCPAMPYVSAILPKMLTVPVLLPVHNIST